MPELPEVELAARALRRWLVGEVLHHVELLDDRAVRAGEEHAFEGALRGRRVEGVHRHGKHLLVCLDSDRALWVHLGMTGKLVRWGRGQPTPKYERVRLETQAGLRVSLDDPRKLGAVFAGETRDVRDVARLDTLGPDALEVRTAEALARALGQGQASIKTTMMDQGRLAGLGNIQAAEALWHARIHPDRATGSLSRAELARLSRGIATTLENTLSTEPSEGLRYLSEGAHVENPFNVYGRLGEPCPRCTTAIARLRHAGRSTYLCPACQQSTA